MSCSSRGIYIHIPFCEKICSYCDYFVVKGKDGIDGYLDSLLKEINLTATLEEEVVTGSEITSIYIGGGTPSLLSGDQMQKIIDLLRKSFQISDSAEITTESNPNSLDKEKLKQYKDIGINRISIGVQSFVKKELGLLTRNHSPKRAESAITEALEAGIESVNLDIIFSNPWQTLESLTHTLEKGISLGTNHFSAYSLIYEPDTPLFKKWKSGIVTKHDDDTDASFYEAVQDVLSMNSFTQYEVSNFSKEGNECRHNLHAWHGGEYFAFGASAHGYLNGRRFSKPRDIQKWQSYLSRDLLPIENTEVINLKERKEEMIFLPIRADGFSIKDYIHAIGVEPPAALINKLDDFSDKGMIKNENHRYKLTSKGYRVCDSITIDLINSL
ncbi:MAG: radical SAM family heme chaperone HemW [Candidatus Kapaibacteriales bacterium]